MAHIECEPGFYDTYIRTMSTISKEKLEKLKATGLPISFIDRPDYFDEVGGFHSEAMGWNPNGVWCGECTKISCANCSSRNAKEDR